MCFCFKLIVLLNNGRPHLDIEVQLYDSKERCSQVTRSHSVMLFEMVLLWLKIIDTTISAKDNRITTLLLYHLGFSIHPVSWRTPRLFAKRCFQGWKRLQNPRMSLIGSQVPILLFPPTSLVQSSAISSKTPQKANLTFDRISSLGGIIIHL